MTSDAELLPSASDAQIGNAKKRSHSFGFAQLLPMVRALSSLTNRTSEPPALKKASSQLPPLEPPAPASFAHAAHHACATPR